MEKVKKVFEKYGVFAWWIFMCLMMVAAITGCILGMSKCGVICWFGLIGSFFSLLIFAWQAYGEWLEIKQS